MTGPDTTDSVVRTEHIKIKRRARMMRAHTREPVTFSTTSETGVRAMRSAPSRSPPAPPAVQHAPLIPMPDPHTILAFGCLVAGVFGLVVIALRKLFRYGRPDGSATRPRRDR